MVRNNGRNNSLVISEIETEPLPEEQTYQGQLRSAIYDGVTEGDVKQIVEGIVGRAKEGDKTAINQFFDFVVGGKAGPKNVTVNNHFADVEQGARLTRRKK